jgi:hypothetical protein
MDQEFPARAISLLQYAANSSLAKKVPAIQPTGGSSCTSKTIVLHTQHNTNDQHLNPISPADVDRIHKPVINRSPLYPFPSLCVPGIRPFVTSSSPTKSTVFRSSLLVQRKAKSAINSLSTSQPVMVM